MTIKYIPLKRRNLNNPQIHSYTEAIRLGQESYHIFPEDSGWEIKQIGIRSSIELFATKKEAISRAKELVSKNKSDIFIHSQNGLIESRISS